MSTHINFIYKPIQILITDLNYFIITKYEIKDNIVYVNLTSNYKNKDIINKAHLNHVEREKSFCVNEANYFEQFWSLIKESTLKLIALVIN